jgi:hypothetical protein
MSMFSCFGSGPLLIARSLHCHLPIEVDRDWNIFGSAVLHSSSLIAPTPERLPPLVKSGAFFARKPNILSPFFGAQYLH